MYLMLLTLLRWCKATGAKSAGRNASVVVARSCVAARRNARRACILVGIGRRGEVKQSTDLILVQKKP